MLNGSTIQYRPSKLAIQPAPSAGALAFFFVFLFVFVSPKRDIGTVQNISNDFVLGRGNQASEIVW